MRAFRTRVTCRCGPRLWTPELLLVATDSMSPIARSAGLFVLAGLAEIGGGYLLWRWLRESGSITLGLLGGALLIVYGIIPTLQPSTFGRTYAAYGGVFVVLSLLWGWWIDAQRSDTADAVGGLVCLIGVSIIMYWPRAH
jgi:small multidrug resistance family-3 protein